MSISGPTILLTSGNYFSFVDIENNQYTIDDIANALSKNCRFTGHLNHFYSVAQHSVMVSRLVPKAQQLAALLHDGSEAFMGDMNSPLKSIMSEYKALERKVQAHIYKTFGCTDVDKVVIKMADDIMLATEKRDFQHWDDHVWECIRGVDPLEYALIPLTPNQARAEFLDRFYELC